MGKSYKTSSILDLESKDTRPKDPISRLHDAGRPKSLDVESSDLPSDELAARLRETEERLEITQVELNMTRAMLLQKEQLLNSITRTLGWRLLTRFGPIKHGVLLPTIRGIKNLLSGKPIRPAVTKKDYREWARRCEQYRYHPDRAATRIQQLNYQPTISIITPCYNTPAEYLRKAFDSLLAQYYTNWELCVCDDASTVPHVREIIAEYAAKDARIKPIFSEKNGGIVGASNAALELASGEFVGFLDHDDELTPDALFEVVLALQDQTVDWVYSDEDKLDTRGNRCERFSKPAWSPDHLLSTMYTCHFSVYRKSMVEKIGGLRTGFEGSQDHDLALRMAEATSNIVHIPKVLYHWRKIPGSAASGTTAKPYAYDAGIKALTDALKRRGIPGSVEPGPVPGQYRVKREVRRPGKVSIIIPTRDKPDLLKKCISSIETRTDYPNYEIIIVDNASSDRTALEYLRQSPHRVIRDESPFNFSRLNNLAAARADGDYLLLLNNDTEVVTREWMSALVEHAQRDEVGAVGAKLLYPKNTIQHAGVVLGLHGVANHAHRNVDSTRPASYHNFAGMIRNYSAVTGACLMTRRSLFEELGGLNERDLAVSFNDIDYCLRLRQKGYLVVYTPYAVLYHYESATRSSKVDISENSYMLAKWGQLIESDPYYNPSQSRDFEDFRFDFSKPEAFCAAYSYSLPEKSTAPLINDLVAGQYFHHDGREVCGISVKFEETELPKGTVRLSVSASHTDRTVIASAELDTSSINVKEETLFLLDPFSRPESNRLYFFIQFSGTGIGPSITKSKLDSSLLGPYYQNHRPLEGTLCFTVYTHEQHRQPEMTKSIPVSHAAVR